MYYASFFPPAVRPFDGRQMDSIPAVVPRNERGEIPLDLSIKTVRQTADTSPADSAEELLLLEHRKLAAAAALAAGRPLLDPATAAAFLHLQQQQFHHPHHRLATDAFLQQAFCHTPASSAAAAVAAQQHALAAAAAAAGLRCFDQQALFQAARTPAAAAQAAAAAAFLEPALALSMRAGAASALNQRDLTQTLYHPGLAAAAAGYSSLFGDILPTSRPAEETSSTTNSSSTSHSTSKGAFTNVKPSITAANEKPYIIERTKFSADHIPKIRESQISASASSKYTPSNCNGLITTATSSSCSCCVQNAKGHNHHSHHHNIISSNSSSTSLTFSSNLKSSKTSSVNTSGKNSIKANSSENCSTSAIVPPIPSVPLPLIGPRPSLGGFHSAFGDAIKKEESSNHHIPTTFPPLWGIANMALTTTATSNNNSPLHVSTANCNKKRDFKIETPSLTNNSSSRKETSTTNTTSIHTHSHSHSHHNHHYYHHHHHHGKRASSPIHKPSPQKHRDEGGEIIVIDEEAASAVAIPPAVVPLSSKLHSSSGGRPPPPPEPQRAKMPRLEAMQPPDEAKASNGGLPDPQRTNCKSPLSPPPLIAAVVPGDSKSEEAAVAAAAAAAMVGAVMSAAKQTPNNHHHICHPKTELATPSTTTSNSSPPSKTTTTSTATPTMDASFLHHHFLHHHLHHLHQHHQLAAAAAAAAASISQTADVKQQPSSSSPVMVAPRSSPDVPTSKADSPRPGNSEPGCEKAMHVNTNGGGKAVSRKRSMLECLADSEGYVGGGGDKKRTGVEKDLSAADPSELGREERALQRAILKFEELEGKGEAPKALSPPLLTSSPPAATDLSGALREITTLRIHKENGGIRYSICTKKRKAEDDPTTPGQEEEATKPSPEHQDEIRRSPHHRKVRLAEVKTKRKLRKRLLARLQAGGSSKREQPQTAEGSDKRRNTTAEAAGAGLTSLNPALRQRRMFYHAVRRRRLRSGLDMIAARKKRVRQAVATLKARKECLRQSKMLGESSGVPPDTKRIMVNKALGETVLHRAARLGYTDVVLYCLGSNDSEVNARDNAGYTPLHECCSRGHLQIARALLQFGADVNASAAGGIRPLHDAVENNHVEVVRLLLSYGADATIATYSGLTPLKLARSPVMMEFLRGFLADLNGEPIDDNPVLPWQFAGTASCLDPKETGYDLFEEVPSDSEGEEEGANDILFEVSESPHLPTFRLMLPDESGKALYNCVRFSDVLRQVNMTKEEFQQTHRAIDVVNLSRHEFETSATCSQLLTGNRLDSLLGDVTGTAIVEVVRLDSHLREILGIETVTLR